MCCQRIAPRQIAELRSAILGPAYHTAPCGDASLLMGQACFNVRYSLVGLSTGWLEMSCIVSCWRRLQQTSVAPHACFSVCEVSSKAVATGCKCCTAQPGAEVLTRKNVGNPHASSKRANQQLSCDATLGVMAQGRVGNGQQVPV